MHSKLKQRVIMAPLFLVVIALAGCPWYNDVATLCGVAASMCTNLATAIPQYSQQFTEAATALTSAQKVFAQWPTSTDQQNAINSLNSAESTIDSLSQLTTQQKVIVAIVVTTIEEAIALSTANGVTMPAPAASRSAAFLKQNCVTVKSYKKPTELKQQFDKLLPSITTAGTP